MDKQNDIYTVVYYSAIKRNEISIYDTTWIDLEIMINEISQKQKGQIVYDSSYMRYLERADS